MLLILLLLFCSSESLSLQALWELLQLVAFEIPAHLGVTSYTINADVKHALALSSGCWIWFLFPIHAEDCVL